MRVKYWIAFAVVVLCATFVAADQPYVFVERLAPQTQPIFSLDRHITFGEPVVWTRTLTLPDGTNSEVLFVTPAITVVQSIREESFNKTHSVYELVLEFSSQEWVYHDVPVTIELPFLSDLRSGGETRFSVVHNPVLNTHTLKILIPEVGTSRTLKLRLYKEVGEDAPPAKVLSPTFVGAFGGF